MFETPRFRRYSDKCREAHILAMEELMSRLPAMNERDASAMAESLVTDAYYRLATGAGGLEFSYEPQRTHHQDGVRWHLQLGAWAVGHVDDPASLQPLAVVHQKLRALLSARAEFNALANAGMSFQRSIDELQRALGPDGRLRNLVLKGCCHLCP